MNSLQQHPIIFFIVMEDGSSPVIKPVLPPILETLRTAFIDLPATSLLYNSKEHEAAILTVAELGIQSFAILSSIDPRLYRLSDLLTNFKSLAEKLSSQTEERRFLSSIRRLLIYYEISTASKSIVSEIRSQIDLQYLLHLVDLLKQRREIGDDSKVVALRQMDCMLSAGFDKDLQSLILESKIVSILNSTIQDQSCSDRLREQAAMALTSLIRFNRDVFVGLVMILPTINALMCIGSGGSITVICSLIKLIKSPVVDEILSGGKLERIIFWLNSVDYAVRIAALECVLAIGYYGRKEAVATMIGEGVVEKLVELQRCRRMKNPNWEENECGEFEGCVAMFEAQMEMGEGLRTKEKREMRKETLKRVKESSCSEAEFVSIAVEVLWGSSPL